MSSDKKLFNRVRVVKEINESPAACRPIPVGTIGRIVVNTQCPVTRIAVEFDARLIYPEDDDPDTPVIRFVEPGYVEVLKNED
jgi:hypothetical protein